MDDLPCDYGTPVGVGISAADGIGAAVSAVPGALGAGIGAALGALIGGIIGSILGAGASYQVGSAICQNT